MENSPAVKLSSLSVMELKNLLNSEIEKREIAEVWESLYPIAEAPVKILTGRSAKVPAVYNGKEYKSWIAVAVENDFPVDECSSTDSKGKRMHAQLIRAYIKRNSK